MRKIIQLRDGSRSRKLGRPGHCELGNWNFEKKRTAPIILNTGLGGLGGFVAAGPAEPAGLFCEAAASWSAISRGSLVVIGLGWL